MTIFVAVFFKKSFYDSVFQRVEIHHNQFSVCSKTFSSSSKSLLQLAQFIIYGNSQCLKRTSCWVNSVWCFVNYTINNFSQFFGCRNRFVFTKFNNSFSNLSGFSFFAVVIYDIGQLSLRQ